MDPVRLVDSAGDGFERSLIRAARRDEPPIGAIARGAAVLGLAAGSASLAVTTAGTASAAGAKASSVIVGSLSVAKWIGIGATVGLVAVSGVQVAQHPEIVRAALKHDAPRVRAAVAGMQPHARREVTPRTNGTSNPPPEVAPPPEAASEIDESVGARGEGRLVPARSADAFREQRSAKAAEAPAVRDDSQPVVAPPSLAAEIRALGRARQALLSHAPSDALGALEEYQSIRRTTVLDAEAELLRIEALLQGGYPEGAKSLAERSLERTPNGPHAARLRQIIEGNR